MSKYLGAVGIVVNDLEKSVAFYSKVLGMVEFRTIELPSMKEKIMGFEGSKSAALILMQYHDKEIARKNQNAGKLVYYVDDTAATITAVKKSGGVIDREAGTHKEMGASIIGLARDLDGHQLELIQKPPK